MLKKITKIHFSTDKTLNNLKLSNMFNFKY